MNDRVRSALTGHCRSGRFCVWGDNANGTAQWPSRCLLFSTHEKSMRLIQTNLSLRDRCAHRSWQSASPNAARKHAATAKRNGFPRRFAQRDGGIPRFINLPPVPLGGMTHVFYPLLFLFPIGNFRTLATPQALCASSPRRGAKSSLFPTGAFSTPATPQSASLTASRCGSVTARL